MNPIRPSPLFFTFVLIAFFVVSTSLTGCSFQLVEVKNDKTGITIGSYAYYATQSLLNV